MRYVLLVAGLAIGIVCHSPKAYVDRDVQLRRKIETDAQERISKLQRVPSSVELHKLY